MRIFLGDLIVQLARPEAYFTTGATWDVNGGCSCAEFQRKHNATAEPAAAFLP